MDGIASAGGNDETSELEALTRRVQELERVVAELRGRAPGEVLVRPRRAEPAAVSAPPPPMPFLPARVPEAAPAPAMRVVPAKSLEDRLGSQIFNMVGIFAIIFGTAYFLKLAIEHGWIGPLGRVLIGLVAGAALVVWSEVFRRKGLTAFSYSLKAIGSGVLYLSLWASFHLYHQLPASVALVAMILVTAWNAWMAVSQDAELLAGYALAGGLLTPLLLSSGGDHEAFLFTYLAAIDLGVMYLLRTKRWRWLVLPSFAGTLLYFVGWYAEFFGRTSAREWTAQSTETCAYALLFFAIFALLTVKGWVSAIAPEGGAAGRRVAPVEVLGPLGNAAFLALALYSVLQDSGKHDLLAWLMIALAALFLGMMRLQRLRVAGAMYLAAAVVCLTVAIPLKASGHTLTTAWLVEGLVLYWAGTRFEDENGAPSKMLWALSLGGFVLGLGSLVAHWWWFGASNAGFANRNLAAALVAVAALAGVVWLASRGPRRQVGVVGVALAAIAAVGVLLGLREIGSTWDFSDGYQGTLHPAFANADFWTAVVGLGVLAGMAWVAFRLSGEEGETGSLRSLGGLAAGGTVVFHLLTILSVEREIGALWSRSEANVQRSLAISAFLMAYGAGLLAVGFVRRTAFVRWQGLVLLVFTICKVFLYDISGLSAGYRVASFMGLGAVLMGVSYAYQKDWLGLKHAPAQAAEETR